MGCNKCKNKKHDSIITEQEEYVDSVRPSIMWAIGIWGVLGLYGLVSLLFDVFSLL